MSKKILMAAAALSVMACAGAASAHTLTFRAATASTTDIDAGTVGGPTGTFLLASEIDPTQVGDGILALNDTLTSGSSIPSGNNLYTISLTNATFGSNITTAVVSGTDCTAVLSSGGGANSNSVTFLVSSSGGGTCSSFDLDLPVSPNALGTVTVQTFLRTENNNPIDNSPASLDVITVADAFQVEINGVIGEGAGLDTYALLADPTYTTLAGDGVLGEVSIAVNTAAHYDLDPTALVTLADVEDATVTVEGSFTAFDGPTDPTLEDATLDSLTATTAVFNPTGLARAAADTADTDTFTVTPDGDIIPASTYRVNVSYTLDPSIYVEQADVSGSFERIEREGTNVMLPWMNDANTAAATGTNNIVRVSNLGSEPAVVSADVLTSNQAGYADGGIVQLGTVPAGGELVIRAANLAPFGNFGRGDVELIVEADPEQITVKRYAQLANGSTTEVESGTVASDQNVELVP